MADWTNLPNQAVGVGGLPSGTTVTALRDNPVAIAQGAAGAPRVQMAAFPTLAAGGVVKYSNPFTASTESSSYIDAIFLPSIIQFGVLRVGFQHRETANVGGGRLSEARVVRKRGGSDAVIATFSTTSPSFQTRSVDVSVIPGDLLLLQHRRVFEGAGSEIRNASMSTDGTDIIPISDGGLWSNINAAP